MILGSSAQILVTPRPLDCVHGPWPKVYLLYISKAQKRNNGLVTPKILSPWNWSCLGPCPTTVGSVTWDVSLNLSGFQKFLFCCCVWGGECWEGFLGLEGGLFCFVSKTTDLEHITSEFFIICTSGFLVWFISSKLLLKSVNCLWKCDEQA